MKTKEMEELNELALFAGVGGGILGGKLLGWRTACAVEIEPYAIACLAQRQNDGVLETFPIWDDVCTFDGRPWNGLIDVVSGGFPCQDISPARTNSGKQGQGLSGKKSGLWREMYRIVCEVNPPVVLVENSAHLRSKGLDTILKDLANAGYNAKWGVFSAKEIGANHERKRMFILAYSNSTQLKRGGISSRGKKEVAHACMDSWWENKSSIHRVVDGTPHRVDRLKAIGNGQVPGVVKAAWKTLLADSLAINKGG